MRCKVPTRFLSTLSLRRATVSSLLYFPFALFLSTLSLRRATKQDSYMGCCQRYFYPRSPCGERRLNHEKCALNIYFYPRSPCGERPGIAILRICTDPISIHALLAESDAAPYMYDYINAISIHALLAESDYNSGWHACCHRDFYPRSPCGERPSRRSARKVRAVFLSTLSLRRATTIQILTRPQPVRFLSTLSLRRATSGFRYNRRFCAISIHALLAESDRGGHISKASSKHFYPRSPCGERPSRRKTTDMTQRHFYPRSPCGERRHPKTSDHPHNTISIHALLAESDFTALHDILKLLTFLSTLSLRRATGLGWEV